MKLCICTKFHEYILNGFREVKHKSTSLMVLKMIQWTLFLNQKGIILLKKSDVVMILALCKFSDHALNLYQVS